MSDYQEIGLLADSLLDAQQVRIASGERLRSVAGMPKGAQIKDYTPQTALQEILKSAWGRHYVTESGLELELKRAVRRTPLGPWVKATAGIGELQAGRMLGVIGDPAVRTDEEAVFPRTLAQLRQYCGYGSPSVKKRGEKTFWNPDAKMRVYLIAEACIKQTGIRGVRSPYRDVYDAGREQYAEAVHDGPCVRCGPKGKPAVDGSPLSDGHKHMRAMRLVCKAILADLWAEASEFAASQGEREPQCFAAGGINLATGQDANDPHSVDARSNPLTVPHGECDPQDRPGDGSLAIAHGLPEPHGTDGDGSSSGRHSTHEPHVTLAAGSCQQFDAGCCCAECMQQLENAA